MTHQWVQAGHPRYTGARTREDVGGPTAPRRNDRQTTVKKFRLTQQPSADRHLETYMVVEPELSKSVNEHVVNRVEVETSRIIKKINQEKINNKTRYIKISQNQYTDKVVDVTVVIQKQVSSRIKRRAERVGERDSTSGIELDLRCSERAC